MSDVALPGVVYYTYTRPWADHGNISISFLSFFPVCLSVCLSFSLFSVLFKKKRLFLFIRFPRVVRGGGLRSFEVKARILFRWKFEWKEDNDEERRRKRKMQQLLCRITWHSMPIGGEFEIGGLGRRNPIRFPWINRCWLDG